MLPADARRREALAGAAGAAMRRSELRRAGLLPLGSRGVVVVLLRLLGSAVRDPVAEPTLTHQSVSSGAKDEGDDKATRQDPRDREDAKVPPLLRAVAR